MEILLEARRFRRWKNEIRMESTHNAPIAGEWVLTEGDRAAWNSGRNERNFISR
jgi:hypothetical protein